jgi:hypothetical protein
MFENVEPPSRGEDDQVNMKSAEPPVLLEPR